MNGSRCPDGGPARILVMLDRPELVELVTVTLNHGTCLVRTVATAEQLATLAAEWQPHLLVLDMALNGLRVMQQVRTRAISVSPMLVMGLVCRGDLRSKLAAFDAGADDILTIPFAPEELLTRVIGLTRRSRTAPIASTPVITVGELEIDVIKRVVRADSSDMRLTPMEVGLLYLLAANPGRVLTRAEIFDTLWGTDNRAEHKLVDQHVRNLRASCRLMVGCRGSSPRWLVAAIGFCVRAKPANAVLG